MKIVYKDGDRVAIEMVFKQMNTKIHGPKSYLQKTAHTHTCVSNSGQERRIVSENDGVLAHDDFVRFNRRNIK